MFALLFLGVLFQETANLHGQESPFNPELSAQAARIHEKVDCFTDRSLYICDELIRFRATIHGQVPLASGPWSTVLYVELVSAEGERLAGGKYPLRDNFASGGIRIPAKLRSGSYYLRSYTRWMRNRGPETYSYVPLRIINPQQADLAVEIGQDEAGIILSVVPVKRGNIEFTAHQGFFGRGEPVSMNLLLSGNDHTDSLAGCLTVVPLRARPAELFLGRHGSESDSADDFRLNFLPDKYGPSISGSVIYPRIEDEGLEDEGLEDEAMKPARIHFTLMGKRSGYFVCRSDAYGRFIVGLPARTGKLELFVQPESPDDEAVEVRIDQDFDPSMIRLPAASFTLSEEEGKTATIMSRNVQLLKIYTGNLPAAEAEPEQDSLFQAVPFYGSPSRSVDLDKYVMLPTLKEVFLNLVPGVTPLTRRNRTILQIYSANPSLSLYDPLLMIDQVPVLDMDQFMSVSPAKIRWVDVLEDVYVKGDLRFGGVINLRSREQDMAGIDLPDNSFFIDYQAMHPSVPSIPDHLSHDSLNPDERIPDTRNTFLWMADFKLGKGIPEKVSFVAPDYPGEYLVLFRGQDAQGGLIVAETVFEVR